MSEGRGWIDHAAWNAANQRWYADLVANCMNLSCAPDDAAAVLGALNEKPVMNCLFMSGAQLDGRHRDIDDQLWSDDAKGRWSAKIDGKKVYLHHRIVELQPNRTRANGDVVSHLCGHCDCIRLEHIAYQSCADDIRDRRHHLKRKRGEIRSDSVARVRPCV